MRKIKDVILNAKELVDKEKVLKYFNLQTCKDYNALLVLYYFNISGFFIPFKPSCCESSLDNKKGWIELARSDKKIEYHNNDGVKSLPGDIALTNDIHIITTLENVVEFIRLPDYYLYTNIHLNVKKKNKNSYNKTLEDLYMLDDANNHIEIAQSDDTMSLCDYHEDGA